MPLSRKRQRVNFLIQAVLKGIKCHFHVIMALKVEPELCFHVKKPPEAKRSISSDSAPSMHYFVDAPRGYANILCQPILGDLHRLQEFRQ